MVLYSITAVEVGFVRTAYTVEEGKDAGMSICVALNGTLERTVTVNVATVNNTATTNGR